MNRTVGRQPTPDQSKPRSTVAPDSNCLKDAFAVLNFRAKIRLDIFKQAAHLHHRTIYFHAFPNGNGRWSGMLANIRLRLNKTAITNWPEETIGAVSTTRDEYIVAMFLTHKHSATIPAVTPKRPDTAVDVS